MATGRVYKTRDDSAADIQVGGAGYLREYYPCTGVGGPTQDFGAINPIYCPDPASPSGVIVRDTIRDTPGLPTFDITQDYALQTYMEELRCAFNMYGRHFCGGARHDPGNYEQILVACNVQMTQRAWDGLVSRNEENAEIVVTGNMTAESLFFIHPVRAERILADYAELNVALNDVFYCDWWTCGDCDGVASDACQRWYAVGDDRGPGYAYGANPILLMYDGTRIGANNKRRVREIVGLLGNAIFGYCVGDNVFAHDDQGSYAWINDPWNNDHAFTIVHDQFEAGHNPTAAYVNGRKIWLSAEGGYVYRSVDGGMTFEVVNAADVTAQDLNAIHGLDDRHIVAVGDAGAVVISTNGGETWADANIGAVVALTCVFWPRGLHIYTGGADGAIYVTMDEGEIWAEVAVAALGGAFAIVDLAFCGGCAGEVGYALALSAGGDPLIARSLDGGASWEEEIAAPANAPQLNSLACCDPNEFVAVGELYGGGNPYAAVIHGYKTG